MNLLPSEYVFSQKSRVALARRWQSLLLLVRIPQDRELKAESRSEGETLDENSILEVKSESHLLCLTLCDPIPGGAGVRREILGRPEDWSG